MRASLLLLLLCLSAFVAEAQSSAGMSMGRPLAIGSVTAPARPDTRPAYQSASTRAMAARLAQTYRATDWRLDPSKPALRMQYYQGLLKNSLSLADETTVRLQLAREQLGAGENEAAIATLEHLRELLSGNGATASAKDMHELLLWLALSYMRLGEQQNCGTMHGQSACLFPLLPSAIHRLPRGAAGAVRSFTALLEQDPKDALSRWLLNVAYMQLGRYPQDVPARWLLPETLFRSEEAFPLFPEEAAAAGVDIQGHAGGVVVEDFDGDGWLDILVTSSGPLDQMHLFHNNGDATFTDVTRAAGLLGETGGLNVVVTDYNNDGHPDVLVLRGGWWGVQGRYPLSLLRNNGDGTFDDVTVAAGLLSASPTQTAAWADYDNDGWLDLMVGHESRPGEAEPSQLFHNNHDGTFTEVGVASGLASLGFVKGVAWGDYDNDGFPDLYVSCLGGANHLFHNDGKAAAHGGWQFTDVTAKAGVAGTGVSFATWFFDYNNDGWPDIFVAGYETGSAADVGAFEAGQPFHAAQPKLFRNNHNGTFTEVAHATGIDRVILPMGANFGDLDNDGWLDVYLGTGSSEFQAVLPNRMFRNVGGKHFADITTAGGFGHLQKGHGVAFADLENRGVQDVFEEMGGAQVGDSFPGALYRNPGTKNHSFTVELEGVTTNRAAFGTRLDAVVQSGEGMRRHICRSVGYGSSFGGNPLRVLIGLGPAEEAESLSVFWPRSRTTQHFLHVHAGTMYRLREGGTLTRWIPGAAMLPAPTRRSSR